MPNSSNYGTPLTSTELQRPSRLLPSDIKLLKLSDTSVLFGTTNNDVVEFWVYNADGTIANHATLPVGDASLRQVTVVDSNGSFETLNIDIGSISQTLGLQAGRYAMVANFFRNQIGSEAGNQLYISDISDDRTELRLLPVENNDVVRNQIYDFIIPAVPRQFAQGLIDQAFGVAVNSPIAEEISFDAFINELGIIATQVQAANLTSELQQLYSLVLSRTYTAALDNMANDIFNYTIRQTELETYIVNGLQSVVYNLTQNNEHDPRFLLI